VQIIFVDDTKFVVGANSKVTIDAFNEDKDILEAQQTCIALDPAAPTVNVHADWGGVQARRLVAQLLDSETASAKAAAE